MPEINQSVSRSRNPTPRVTHSCEISVIRISSASVLFYKLMSEKDKNYESCSGQSGENS